MAFRWAILPLVCFGCGNETRQPWRAALDQGKGVKLGGEIGKLTPPNARTPIPPTSILPNPYVAAPIDPPSKSTIPEAVKNRPIVNDSIDIPPPPKALEGKPKPVVPRGE